jgi:hypothetical protein
LIPAWQLRWDETNVSGSMQMHGGAAAEAQGEIKLKANSLRRLLNTMGVDLPATRDPQAYGALNLNARWNYRNSGAALESLDATLDGTHAQGSVTLPQLSPLAVRFDLAADRVDADRYLEPEDAKRKPFELPLTTLKVLDAKGVLRIREARVAGATAKELTIDVD